MPKINQTQKIKLSIIIASNNSKRLSSFFDSIIDMNEERDLRKIEILLNVCHKEDIIRTIKKYSKTFQIKYIVNEYRYLELNKGYNELVKMIDKNSQYVSVQSDNFRLLRFNYIRKIISHFSHEGIPHHIRISNHRKSTNKSIRRSWDKCENWGFYNRKWLKIAGGYGDFWCPDATQEIIFFFIKRLTKKKLSKSPHATIVKIPHKKINAISYNSPRVIQVRGAKGEVFYLRHFLNIKYLGKLLKIAKKMTSLNKSTMTVSRYFILQQFMLSARSKLFRGVFNEKRCRGVIGKKDFVIVNIACWLSKWKVTRGMLKIFERL